MRLKNRVAGLAAALSAATIAWSCSSGNGGTDAAVQDGGIDADIEAEVQQDTPTKPECDPLFQDCVIDEGCYLKGGGKVGCETAGTAKEGEACVFVNSCEAGLVCVNLDSGSVCAVLCSVSDDQNAKACKTICKQTYGTLADTDGLGFCKAQDPIIPCDILAQDCPEGQGCYLSQTGISCVKTSKGLDLDATCEFANECKPGLVCVNAVCHKVCDPDKPDCPLNLPTCGAMPGVDGAGVCVEQG
ncbi:MAG: hypothetical protein GXP54_02115 [Deltaproteobacteria bacterium]|nr:hypothetical protein [Deltaproteobacteria bacterium]